MNSELDHAIRAVKENEYSFCKFISPNDAGVTGGHQAGLYIPHNSYPLLFNTPGLRGHNREKTVRITWADGTEAACRFIYYGQGTRNEYRITRLGKRLVEDQLIIIVKKSGEQYQGFLLSDDTEINEFLTAFSLSREQTNRLIPAENHRIASLQTMPDAESGSSPVPENTSEYIAGELSFKPKAHILVLLGEELIKSPVMAIYELIKNSYDADATQVDVIFEDIEHTDKAKVKIRDTGTGIIEDVLKNVWFEPGTDFRKPVNGEGVRELRKSPVYNRIPMGEKGVGRFAVHKLGHQIKMITRPAEIIYGESGELAGTVPLDYELVVEIDWKKFSQSKYLEDVIIGWKKNLTPDTFMFREGHGTYIEVTDLKDKWTRGMARQLKNQTISMVSPKNDPGKFRVNLDFRNWWLDNIPETASLLQQAPYKLMVLVDSEYNMTFDYSFSLYNNPDVGSRVISEETADTLDRAKFEKNIKEELRPIYRKYLEDREYDEEVIENLLESLETDKLPFGNMMLEFYSYDLDSPSLKDTTNAPKLIRDLLREHAGIKVFKGDLRVYDYGDPGNDWLGLDLKRVQNKEWFSNNQNIGYVYLDPETSGALIEKTNREGFIHNQAYEHLQVLLLYILTEFKAERHSDRERWRRYNKKGNDHSFESQLSLLKEHISGTEMAEESKQKLLAEAGRVEERYEQDKNTLLIPAGVGMTASFAMHEIEKLLPRMEETVRESPLNEKKIALQVEELKDYVEGILSVLKKGGNKPVSLSEAVKQAVSNYSSRARQRQILFELDFENEELSVVCDKRLLITMLMNILDNSIYWLDTVFRDFKGVYITAHQSVRGTSLLVVDSGPGFRDKKDDLVMPFFTRKENGIGIGMYLLDTVMVQYGRLDIIYDRAYLTERGVPEVYTGAAVELIFNKNQ